MSIEALLTRVAEALEANTDAMRALMKDSAGSKPASKPASSTKAADKPASKPAAKPAPKTTKSKGETTVEDVTEKVTTYLKTGSKAEREERKGHVKAILDHYEADRFTNIDPENFDEALGFLAQFEEGEDPFGGDGAEEEDEDGAMV